MSKENKSEIKRKTSIVFIFDISIDIYILIQLKILTDTSSVPEPARIY